MKKCKSELKKLAQMAKLRMKEGYGALPKKEKVLPDIPLAIKKEELAERIAEMVRNCAINPLGQLTDKSAYQKMSSDQKDRYILQLSKIYKYYSDRANTDMRA